MLEERVCFETGQLQDDPKSYLQKAAHRSHTNSNLKSTLDLSCACVCMYVYKLIS